jgi:hypothetical protein
MLLSPPANKGITRTNLAMHLDASDPSCYADTGTTINDLSGSENNGTLEGGCSVAGTGAGKYFDISGSPQYISTTFNPNLDNKRLYSYEVWFWDNSANPVDGTVLIGNYGTSYTLPYSALFVSNSGGVTAGERNTDSSTNAVSSGAVLTNGVWNHIVMTADATSINMYANGSLIGSASRPGGVITSGHNFVIGGNQMGRYQTARIAVVRVYLDRALSLVDVKKHYESEVRRFRISVLDHLSINARQTCIGMFGLRLLNSSYQGAVVRVRRSGDSQEADFYADANGNLGTQYLGMGTSLQEWLGASTGLAIQWYNQGGDARISSFGSNGVFIKPFAFSNRWYCDVSNNGFTMTASSGFTANLVGYLVNKIYENQAELQAAQGVSNWSARVFSMYGTSGSYDFYSPDGGAWIPRYDINFLNNSSIPVNYAYRTSLNGFRISTLNANNRYVNSIGLMCWNNGGAFVFQGGRFTEFYWFTSALSAGDLESFLGQQY